jgi:hypothetical protein
MCIISVRFRPYIIFDIGLIVLDMMSRSDQIDKIVLNDLFCRITGFCTFPIVWYPREHNVSETGPISILRCLTEVVQWLRLALTKDRTIWLLLDSVHRLVCGSWTESKRSQIVLYNIHYRQNLFKSIFLRSPTEQVSSPHPHLRTETDPVSETSCSLEFQTMEKD